VRGDLSPDYATYKMDRYYAYAYSEHEQGQRSIWLRYQSKVKQWGQNVWLMLSKILHKGDD